MNEQQELNQEFTGESFNEETPKVQPDESNQEIKQVDDGNRKETVENEENTEINTKDEAEGKQKADDNLSETHIKALDQALKKLPAGTNYILDKNNEIQFIVPINGKKYQFPLPDIIKNFNLTQAGYQKLSEGKAIEKQNKEFFENMAKDPRTFLQLGSKLYSEEVLEKLAYEFLTNRLQYHNMSPEERRTAQLRQENETLEEKNRRLKYQDQQRQLAGQARQYQEKITGELVDAMKKSGLDSKNFNTKRGILKNAIEKMMFAINKKQNLSTEDAIYLANQDWQRGMMEGFDNLDESKIIDLLPEKIIRAIRNADLSRFKDEPPTSNSGDISGQGLNLKDYQIQKDKQKKKKNEQSMTDYFANL